MCIKMLRSQTYHAECARACVRLFPLSRKYKRGLAPGAKTLGNYVYLYIHGSFSMQANSTDDGLMITDCFNITTLCESSKKAELPLLVGLSGILRKVSYLNTSNIPTDKTWVSSIVNSNDTDCSVKAAISGIL